MKRLLAGLLLLLLLVAPALAQTNTNAGLYQVTPDTLIDGQRGPLLTDNKRRLVVTAQTGAYQSQQTPLVAGSSNVANSSAAATLTGTSTTTVYISGFEMTAGGATASAVVTCTVTGLLGGTRNYTFGFPTGATVAATPLIVEYNPPLPASAVNQAIGVACPAGGTGNTNATMTAHGFYQ